MDKALREKRIRQFFRVSILLKGIHSVLEIICGLALIFISPDDVSQLVDWMTADTLLEDPNDFISNYLVKLAARLSVSSVIFGAAYLLSHGVIKLILVIALLRSKMWAYPWSLGVFSLFIAYQVYRFTITYSTGLFLLTIFDLVVIWLIWREYKIMKRLST